MAVEGAAVVVVMGVGGSSGIGEGKGSGGTKPIAVTAMAGGHTTIN